MQKYGSTPDHYAWTRWKNHKLRGQTTLRPVPGRLQLEEIKAAKMIHDPLTKLHVATSDGSAAAIVASERYVDEHDL